MKAILHSVGLLCLVVMVLDSAEAQPTITSTDISAILSVGKTITTRVDTSTKTANIGSPGATSWDFSALKTSFTTSASIVSPNGTPFSAYFPGATQAELVGGGASTVYEYLALGTNLLNKGTGMTGFLQSRSRLIPDEILYQFPMTMGTTWTSSFVESLYVNLPPPLPPQVTVTNYTVSNTVDAYGSLTLPGGNVYQALRIRTDRRSLSGTRSSRSITFAIFAASGAAVTVVAADSLQPNNGAIHVSDISWSPSATSDVRLSDAVPSSFSLSQNYPNPFNPATKIRFEVRDLGFVSLKVYDVLGREVTTLVNEVKQPGSYETTFDASGLSSGVYFYRMEAGDFVAAKRLLLLR